MSGACRYSFSKQYLPSSAEVLTGLRRSFVLAGLQPDDTLSGTQLHLGPFPFVLLGRSRPQRRTSPFWVLVRLYNRHDRLNPKTTWCHPVTVTSYRSADGEYGHGHSVDVLLFPQVDRLEQVNVWNSVLDASFLKSTKYVYKSAKSECLSSRISQNLYKSNAKRTLKCIEFVHFITNKVLKKI